MALVTVCTPAQADAAPTGGEPPVRKKGEQIRKKTGPREMSNKQKAKVVLTQIGAIRVWKNPSSSSSRPPYTTLLQRDGKLTCDCKGWTILKGPVRECSHTISAKRELGIAGYGVVGSRPADLIKIENFIQVLSNPERYR